EMNARPNGRYAVVGVVAEDGVPRAGAFDCPVLGSLDDLPRVITAYRPEHIVIALAERRSRLPTDRLVAASTRAGIVGERGTDTHEGLAGELAIESLPPSNVIFVWDCRPWRVPHWVARALSAAVAAVGLVLAAPLLGAIAAAVGLDQRGPALFVQDRVGL